jgi:2-oxoglutarate ferredoxin oxidoreductase subunit beta
MATMVTNKITIDKIRCFGCGYCVQFCPKRCLELDINKIGQRGYALPVLNGPDQCNGCGVCVRMCPHWAISVSSESDDRSEAKIGKVIGPPRLAQEPPLVGCAGCQHPTVGRIIAEIVDELGLERKTIAFDNIPCSVSSVFGTDFGIMVAPNENALDLATIEKRTSPDTTVIAVQGYWGMADFSFDSNAFINTLIRGDNLTIILCNTPHFGPIDGRPVPANEPIEGKLIPITQVYTPEGRKIIKGGYPLHITEIVAIFKSVAFSARGALISPKHYQQTKQFIWKAIQTQMSGTGLSFVEVLCTCSDPTYSAPGKCLKWIEEKMIPEFPLGEFTNRERK